MKYYKPFIKALYLITFLTLWGACTKEPAKPVDVSISIVGEGDLRVNTKIRVLIDGTGDFCTFFNGIQGRMYDSIPKAKGSIVNFGDTVFISYPRANVYKITAVAVSYGVWGEEQNLTIAEKEVTINDYDTGITRVFMTEPKYRLASIAGNTITIKTGVIDLTKVSLQVITASLDAIVYPNSDISQGYQGGIEFTADFSNADPHILVESYGKTTQKYNLVFE